MSVIGSNALAGASGQAVGDYVIEKSLRFNDSDSAYLNRTPSSAGTTTTWTFSCWVKRAKGTSSYPGLFSVGANSQVTGFLQITFEADEFSVYMRHSGGTNYAYTNALLRDHSAWYHLVVAMDTTAATEADRLKMYVNGVEQTFRNSSIPAQNTTFLVNGTALHQIGATKNSSGTTSSFYAGYMTDVHLVDGQALNPTSFGEFDDNGVWQAAKFTGSHGTNGFHLNFADANLGTDNSGNNNNWTVNNLSSGVYSGTKPKWYTSTTLYTTKSDVIANATDRGQSAFTLSSDEFVYLVPNDGGAVGEVCHPTGSTYPSTYYMYVRSSGDTSWYNTGSHGSTEAALFQWENTTGTPQAYDYTKTEDLYLVGDTRDAGQPTNDAKMSGSFPALVNLVAEADALRDSPTNGSTDDDTGAGGEVSGNYATWNPVTNKGVVTTSDGNLTANAVNSNYGYTLSTIPVSSGKYYCEISFEGTMAHSTNYNYMGIVPTDSAAIYTGQDIFRADGALAIETNTNKVRASIGTGSGATQSDWNTSYGYDENDTIGIAIDCDTPQVSFYKNGTSIGTYPYSMQAGKSWVLFINDWATGADITGYKLNAGQRPFAYTAPSGYKALCTANLPTPNVPDGSAHFDTKLYSGTGAAQTLSGLSFSPDLVWIKKRSGTSDHAMFDTIRGATKRLYPNDTSGQDTLTDTLTAFNSDGFSLGNANDVNQSGQTYAGWAWDAGDSNTSVSVGSLTSSIYNQDAVWSNFLTSSNGFVGSYTADQAFNEVLDSGGGSATNGSGGVMTFAPTSALSVSTMDIRVYSDTTITFPDNSTVEVDGQGSDLGWISVTLPSSFTGFTGSNSITFHNTNGGLQYFDGLRINGKILVNSNISLSVPSIASNYRANPSAGFSIVSWTGTGSAGTLAHGLQKTPELIITKVYSSSYNDNWPVYHPSYGAGTYMYFNSTIAAPASYLGFFNGVEPTSSVFTVGSANSDNTKDLLALCFTSVEGYSKIGKYTGNGNTDGPFIYTGFRPALVIVKNTSTSASWCLWDSKRPGYNLTDDLFNIDNSNAEAAWAYIDILSNGFKVRGTHSVQNTNSNNYIYAAFAENPFQANGGLAR